jgi:hypothetical protein
MTELSTVTDPYLPEPKNVSTAAAGKVYVADGAGSGQWSALYSSGFEVVDDTTGSQALTASTWVDINNNGSGSDTNTSYLLPSRTTMWSALNNQWDFSGTQLGDVVFLTLKFDVTTTGANAEVAVRLDLAHGTGSEYALELYRNNFKTAGTYEVVCHAILPMTDNTIRNNPAKVAVWDDSSGDSLSVVDFVATTVPNKAVY